jgi:heme-degrading monooxygenase HmoA
MIVRLWSARATAAGAESYATHFRRTILPELQRIAGFRGALLLRRPVTDDVKLIVLTFWESMASIRGFTGDDATAAVVGPEARAVLKEFDRDVEHFDLVLDSRT